MTATPRFVFMLVERRHRRSPRVWNWAMVEKALGRGGSRPSCIHHAASLASLLRRRDAENIVRKIVRRHPSTDLRVERADLGEMGQ